MASTSTRTVDFTRPTSSRRKKDQQRTEIWSNLLRQTREAQARSRRQALQTRDLILCGGTPEDQRTFLERYITRPPPTQPPIRNQQRDQKPRRPKGELVLSNRFAYGYGHVTLFSPPTQTVGNVGLFSGEAEEAAKVNVHTVPEAEGGYEEVLRRLLRPKKEEAAAAEGGDEEMLDEQGTESRGRRAAVCVLMSWKEPWLFLDRLRRWLALLSRVLMPSGAAKNEPPLDVLKEHQISLTLVLQHTDNQELLLRESYTEESFDYISQCLRTCLLPISGALVYVPSSLPPQQPGGPLSEVQKVLYTSLDLDISALQTKGGKPDLTPKHNVVDRMAIVVPSGWDSNGKILLLSETFTPETVLEGWTTDLAFPIFFDPSPRTDPPEEVSTASDSTEKDSSLLQAGAEVFESRPSQQPSPMVGSPDFTPPQSPSKAPKSAIADYERSIHDPNAHKATKAPEIEVTTKPEQEFLAEMRQQLLQYEAQDKDAASRDRDRSYASTTAGSLNTVTAAGRANAPTGLAGATGEALSELGDVSFNVGGVSYNTVSAEAAIERLKRPQPPAGTTDSRSSTPRPSRREGREASPSSVGGSAKGDKGEKSELTMEEMEKYFASLVKKGGGGGGGVDSRQGTPSRH